MKLQFTGAAISIDAAESNEPRITGIAVPYNVTASVSTGQTIKLLAGSMPSEGRMPRLVLEHDTSRVVGVVDQRQDTPDGMLFSARIADTTEGRDLIALLKMGALDSVSVGIQATEFEYEGAVLVVKAAQWDELSVVYEPAFSGAQITQVAASQPDTPSESEADETQPDIPEEETMSQETPAVEASAEIVPTAPIYAAARREFKLPSASEYIASFIRGGHDWAQMNDNIRAAAPDVTTADIPGIVPTPIVAPIFNSFVGSRPLVDATTLRQMPTAGSIFIRPVVKTHGSVGTATQNTTITASTFEVDDVQIQKTIQGGYVEVSEASMDWSQPEVLSALLDDMARVYADRTDLLACSELQTGTTNSNNFANASINDPAYWVEWMYTAAADILTGSNGNLPSILAVSPNVWKLMGSLSDTADRPLFPQVGPMNAFGSLSPGGDAGFAFGLRVVVDRNLTSAGMTILDPRALENWETAKGAITVEQPSQLSRQIAFRGYWASKLIDPTLSIKAAFV
jgi:HK97 family phage prohead protease